MRNQTGYTPGPAVPGTPPTGPAGASSARANCSVAADVIVPNNSAPSEPPDEGDDDDVHCETGGLREQYTEAIWAVQEEQSAPVEVGDPRIVDAVMAVRDRELERLRAELADVEREWLDAANHSDLTCTAVAERDQAQATIDRVRAFAEDMRTWCSPRGVATDYADRLLALLAKPTQPLI